MEENDVIQITGGRYAGCLSIIEKVKNWGVVAYIPSPNGDEYLRLLNTDYTYIGKAALTRASLDE